MNGSVYRLVAALGLAALATVIIVPAALLLTRGDGNAPIQIISNASDPTGDPASAALPTEDPEIRVYVNGAVRKPGVYPLSPGDRLVDALDAAGGAAEGADLDQINLALRVRDEGYYYVPLEGETSPLVASDTARQDSPATSSEESGGGLIDLNTASADVLSTLPGIGQVKAQAIISHRTQNGPLSSIEEITTVPGIGSGTYDQIRDLVTVGIP